MDWGLGNPNKTAALIALLMLAVWALPLLHRWLFWVALPTFAALGACLVHTMSRGGVLAAAAGGAVLIAHLRRAWPWPKGRVLAVAGAVLVMFAGAGALQTSARFAKSHQDRSVSNRLVMWRQAPRMMVDAPWGWGIGNAGTAYMGWYQPLENTETYRTLVNSHLTWLVEMGWLMRMLYVSGWVAVVVLCCGGASDRGRLSLLCGVVCGMWVAFFVAAAFSSVAEVPWLWVPPAAGLAWMLAVRRIRRIWPTRRAWSAGTAAAALGLAALAACGYATESPAGVVGRLVLRRNGAICVGARHPRTWVVTGTPTGDTASVYETYRVYRGRERQASAPVGFAPSAAALPRDLTGCRVAVIGAITDWDVLAARVQACASVLLIAPDVFPEELGLPEGTAVRAVFGEFSNRPSAAAWLGAGLARTLEGVGDFFPDWPGLVFETEDERPGVPRPQGG